MTNRARWVELVIGLGAATAAAAGLWVAGLAELAWLPYTLVAAESGRRSRAGCARAVRREARS